MLVPPLNANFIAVKEEATRNKPLTSALLAIEESRSMSAKSLSSRTISYPSSFLSKPSLSKGEKA